MRMEHLVFLGSVSFLPCSPRKLPEAFGLTVFKSWYPHYFNTEENLDYVGEIPDVSYCGVDELSESERTEFLEWYEGEKAEVFYNRRCQDDVTILREACQVFRREFIQIGKIEVFLEAITIASACNKVLRKRFLKANTIGLIPTGGYSGNVKYSKKALMWLIYREETDGCKFLHDRNGREYRLPELPHLGVDGFCRETGKVYEFFGCYWHGHTCLPFRDVTTMRGDTLAERYEHTMARLEEIARTDFQLEVQWECEFDAGI
jgi:G:T-mismatch repair DNA endonuclease (very short patch repair protein)